ncbi:MAG TPA: hypothetical protein VE959_11795 [Bryobacteraceae bacterium]|nr:hypothetical protein [Bryobacteraceae bacterium]
MEIPRNTFLLLILAAGLAPAADLSGASPAPILRYKIQPAQNIDSAPITKPVPPPAPRHKSGRASAISVDSVVWEGAVFWNSPFVWAECSAVPLTRLGV